MKPENGINNRWKLFSEATGMQKPKFNAYGWYECRDLRISRNEYWSGWWNDCFNFITVYPKTCYGKTIVENVSRVFTEHGYAISSVVNRGISIAFKTMTEEESRRKAERNLLNGGRMSD